ncbi:MAG: DNA methyltransferase [Acidimicrobiales bacterium]
MPAATSGIQFVDVPLTPMRAVTNERKKQPLRRPQRSGLVKPGRALDMSSSVPPAEPYEFLPVLDTDEFAMLKADIASRGVVVPVVVDAGSGAIIDGHHRVRAFEELRAEGISVPGYPREVRRFESEQERVGFVLAANLFRRHLTREQRRTLVARLRTEGWSVRRIAEVVGAGRSTVNRDVAGVPDGTPGPEIVTGADEKSYPVRRPRPAPSILVRSARDETRARAALAALGEDAHGGMELRRAEERGRLAALARRRAGVAPLIEEPGVELRCGDFREVLADLAPASVDAIVCDPPYDNPGVPLYSDLSAFAARVLRPGRLCVAYCGVMALPEELSRLGERLEYVWMGAVALNGRHTLFRQRLVFGCWRPVAFFSAGPYEPRTAITDLLTAEGRGEKKSTDHPWQQATGPFRRLVEMAARPGELVIDPFAGSGTTALACRSTGRRFLGCDVDPGAVALTFERLTEPPEERDA